MMAAQAPAELEKQIEQALQDGAKDKRCQECKIRFISRTGSNTQCPQKLGRACKAVVEDW